MPETWQIELSKIIHEQTGKYIDPLSIYPVSTSEAVGHTERKDAVTMSVTFTYRE